MQTAPLLKFYIHGVRTTNAAPLCLVLEATHLGVTPERVAQEVRELRVAVRDVRLAPGAGGGEGDQ